MSPQFVDTDSDDSDDEEEKNTKVSRVCSNRPSGCPKGHGFSTDKSLEVDKSEKGTVLRKEIYRGKKYHMSQNLIPTTLKKC